MSDQTREIYERARLGQSVTLGERPAVLVVDFSRGFTDPECTMGSDLTQEVEATNRLLATARERFEAAEAEKAGKTTPPPSGPRATPEPEADVPPG